jgi:hypothetical protein
LLLRGCCHRCRICRLLLGLLLLQLLLTLLLLLLEDDSIDTYQRILWHAWDLQRRQLLVHQVRLLRLHHCCWCCRCSCRRCCFWWHNSSIVSRASAA